MASFPRSLGVVATMALGMIAYPVAADTILGFGGIGSGEIIATNPTPSTTTITATDAPVTITTLVGAFFVPISAYFDLSLASVGPAAMVFPGIIGQPYSGSFSFTSGMGDTGTNYLSGTFTDAVFGGGTGLSITASDAVAGEAVSLSSDVVPQTALGAPRSVDFSLADVTPPAAIFGRTLAAFSSSVSGNVSGTYSPILTETPEPASLLVLGGALCGLGYIRNRLMRRRS